MEKKKNLLPEELDALIQEYLTDGVLTDRERQVILRKAASLDLDQDEIDLYLDAQVQKIDQAADTAVRRMKSKACPYCGAPVPQFVDKCPDCGQYITPQGNDDLQDILENLEDALLDLKDAKDIQLSKAKVERYARKAKLYYGSNPKVQKLLAEVETEKELTEKEIEKKRKRERADKRKETLINIFTLSFIEDKSLRGLAMNMLFVLSVLFLCIVYLVSKET